MAKLSELADPGKLLVEVGDRLVVLFLVNGNLTCLDDCARMTADLWVTGVSTDRRLLVPVTALNLISRTGDALTMPATEATIVHHVKTRG